ncbi:O-antigen ligase [Halanaerobium saccharolyticum]|uniref:O-antigen ligase n=1 Tax=Halanaerobium saccharolyticum TaxID=43595 RepID=A0A2T5RQI8_9FIRM|nr:O-antigen ligase family protein [Halanaerobium saccharolyticum]PTW02246.1 O-antigen ligase [Halanaerobium saccharolyticum]
MNITVDKLGFWIIIFLTFSANISVAGVNLSVGLLFILLFIHLFQKRIDIKAIYKESKEVINAILIFFAVLVLSIVFSDYYKLGLDYLDKILRYLIIYFSIIHFIKKKDQLNKIFISLSLSILISSLFSIYQYFILNLRRPAGFLSTLTNESVLLMVLSIMVMLIYRTENKARYYYIFVSLISVLSLIVSNTRGAWIALIIGLLFFAFFVDKKMLVALFIISIVIIVLFPSFKARFNSIFDLNNSSNNERILMWRSAFEMWKDRPIFGHGIGSFEKLYPEKYILDIARVKGRMYAHSNIFDLLAETGIFGLISYLYLFFSIIKHGINRLRILKVKEKTIVYGYFLSFMTFFIHGLTFTNIFISHSANIFWVIIALYIVDLRLLKT